jgi:type I restriction enzyme S subunit
MSSEWELSRLGEVVSLKTGKLDSNAAEEKGKYPFFTCSPTTLKINSFSFDTTAVILAGNNANGVFSTKYYSGKFNAYQRTYIIEPLIADQTNCKYLYFVISDLVGHLKELSIGSATKFLTKTILNELQISLPPKFEQDKITVILGALDDRITLLRETNATLEAIAQALFKSWFVDFDPVHAKQQGRLPEGMDEQTAALFPDSFEESELGLVPLGWEVGTLGDVLTLRNERTKPTEKTKTLPYVPTESISAKIPFLQEYKSGEEANSSLILFHEGDILFGAMRPYFHKVCIAPFDGVTRTTVFTLVAKPNIKEFALFQMYQETTIEYATQHSEGSTIPYAKWDKSLEKMQIVLPPVELQETFSQAVSSFVQKANTNVQMIQTLADLRDTLLPRLISGQLRVGEVEEIAA